MNTLFKKFLITWGIVICGITSALTSTTKIVAQVGSLVKISTFRNTLGGSFKFNKRN